MNSPRTSEFEEVGKQLIGSTVFFFLQSVPLAVTGLDFEGRTIVELVLVNGTEKGSERKVVQMIIQGDQNY
eukprot:4241781-Amphidinium_carterae.1